MARSYGVDLITFFEPSFWRLSSAEEFRSWAQENPRAFWDGVLDALGEAGLTQLEMTFPPADRETAIAAYGSAEAFRAELERRGLRVVSAYFGGLEHAADVNDTAARAHLLEEASTEAEFLATLGADFLVVGLPMRKNADDGRGLKPVDLEAALPIATLLNKLGATTKRHGVTVAIHTESHSVFWTTRDIELFLLLTDPFLVSFCPDTGHIVLGGGDPVHILQKHRDRVVIAHWKDALGAFREDVQVDDAVFVKHRPYFAPAGDGSIDWHAWARTLRDLGYEGDVLLELDAAPDPVAQLKDAKAFLDRIVSITL